mgnify:CR=1 FL=1
MANDKKEEKIQAKAGSIIGSQFAQIGVVHVTDTEVTFEFYYVHPSDNTSATAVGRVTMQKSEGKKLAEITLETIKKRESSKS